MVTTTTVYSFQKPAVAGDEDAWGGYLNNNIDKYESILTGNTTITNVVITTADINGGTLDNVVIGGATPAAITGTTITGTSLVGPLATAAQTNITSLGTLTTLAVTGSATISNASGDTLTLAKDTTEPSFRIEGDANKDFVFTISGELLTLTQNDGATDIVTFDHDTKASSFFGDISVTSGTNAKLTISDSIGEVGSGNLAFQAQNTSGSSLKPMGFRAEDIRFATGSAERLRVQDSGIDVTGNISVSGTGGLTTTGGNNLTVSGSVADHAGLIFATHAILPAEAGAEASANVIDLGANGNEFKSLYLNTSIVTDSDLTVDVGGEIHLDADSGIIRIRDAGGDIGMLRNESNDFTVRSMVGDADLLFKGNDGGSVITGLTLDFSDAGTAIFNHDIKLADNGQLRIGNGDDLLLYHDASNSYIQSKTGNLNITTANGAEFAITAVNNGAVSLFHDGTSKLATTANGINVAGDVVVTNDIYVADQIIHEGDTDTYLQFNAANTFRVVAGNSERLNVNTGGVDVSNGNLNINNNDITGINDIYLASEIYHHGDTDTKIGFGTDTISLYVGGQQTELTTNGLYLHDGSLREDYDALSGTSPNVSVSTGGMFSLTMSGNTTFTFSGATSGFSAGFVLQLTGNGSTVTYPNTVRWAGGSAPDAPASGETDILVFFSRDGGSNWYGVLSSDAAS